MKISDDHMLSYPVKFLQQCISMQMHFGKFRIFRKMKFLSFKRADYSPNLFKLSNSYKINLDYCG